MPLGWERVNTKKSHPNKNIVFIKPLSSSTESNAKDFLERIAAQCLPITNKHYLAVVSLEEYEPNLEFWGRNFNNGEIIQLVLRSPSTGQWLPFKFVQMVMMHELAHCKQMNHGPAFWKLRNEFAADMKELWGKGYTGEGLWGRGVLLENGAFAREELGDGEVLPEHMCGGTFKSRGGKKRKAPKPKITYKERQERRIKKKFGDNGTTLGANDQVKVEFENGKKPAGKPRVAKSNRGRELRAAAALKRFEVAKEETNVKDEDLVTDSETEDDEARIKPELDDAVDIDGTRLVDSHGRGMVKVCEDEDKDDGDAQNELRELAGINGPASRASVSRAAASTTVQKPQLLMLTANTQPSKPRSIPPRSSTLYSVPEWKPPESTKPPSPVPTTKPAVHPPKSTTPPQPTKDNLSRFSTPLPAPMSLEDTPCPICTTPNSASSLACSICSNVLKPDFVPGSWHCGSNMCGESEYINSGYAGICGSCGERKIVRRRRPSFRD
ncbi:WLM domain-containing protein [Amylocarpus encephaloides]|uniref:WLM domain-containing protein n=1 Tax=Amylocarpus encephaloides TaxID=45428 RepID=A0A9P8C6S4_9HELO|nr:WLM domain-containing protein [Amylocarpus encephaloides]